MTYRGSFEGSTVESSSANVVKTDLAWALTTPTFPRSNSRNQRRSVAPGPVCNYCKCRGHVFAECWALEKKRASNPVLIVVKAKYRPQGVHEEKSETSPGKENPFISEGFVSLTESDEQFPIKILRDTGASQSLMVQSVLPLSGQASLAASVLIQGVELNTITVPLHQVYVRSSLITGPVVVGVRSTLPVTGVSFILGNDLAGGKVKPDLWVVNRPDQPMTTDLHGDTSTVFPACVMTRAAARKARINQNKELGESDEAAANSSFNRKPKSQMENDSSKIPTSAPLKVHAKESVGASKDIDHPPFSREQLIHNQEMDPEGSRLMESAVGEDEVAYNPKCYYKKFRVLMRKWHPPDVPADEEW